MVKFDYRRLKSSRGRYPVDSVQLRNSEAGYAEIVFSFPAESNVVNQTAFDLESLACTLPAYPVGDQSEIIGRLSESALLSGPLLGLPAPESISDWMSEIRIAQTAIALQRIINGDAILESSNIPVVKSVISDSNSGDVVFTSYCLSLVSGVGPSAQLEQTFPHMPWMKRFSNEQSCDYIFVCADTSQEQHIIDVHLVAFPKDIPTVDYSFMTAYFESLGHDVSALEEDYIVSDASSLAKPNATLSVEANLEKADLPHLQHIVHALISLHTESVHVDLFKSDGSHDFLAFDTYLSSLWYDFAMRLGKVKVGYCVQCGHGFSLTGHRGMDKEYCSETCRTQAKNERRRTQVAQLRAAFIEGGSVAEIAADVYRDMASQPAQDAVRKSLRKWPNLKHAIEEDIKHGDGTFTQRCLEEGAVDEAFVVRKARAAALAKKKSGLMR